MATLKPLNEDPFAPMAQKPPQAQPATAATPAEATPAMLDPRLKTLPYDPFKGAHDKQPGTEEAYKQATGGDYTQDSSAQFLQGISSWSDEGLAGLRAIPEALATDRSYGDVYNDKVAEEREHLGRFEKYDPDSAQKARVAGMATSMLGPGAVYKGAKALGAGTKMALSAAGFTGGAHYGSGTAAPKPDATMGEAVGERVRSGALPATIGAATAPVMGLVGEKAIGPITTFAQRGYNAIRRPLDAAYEKLAGQAGGDTGIDKLATGIATGTSKKAEDVQRRAFDILGEEMAKANGDAAVAEQAAIQRLMTEHGIAQSTAVKNLQSVRGVNKDSKLFFGEYPAVAESNAATRKQTNPNLAKVGEIEDTPIQNNIDLIGNSGQGQSVSDVRNAVMGRQAGAADDTRRNIQKLSPNKLTIEDVDQMIVDMTKKAGDDYKFVYDPNNKLIDQGVLLQEMQSAIDKNWNKWALRGGEQKDALAKALDEFYITDATTGQRLLMPTLQIAQDARGALRGIIQRNVQSGNNHIVQALQPLYQDVTRAMEKASPAWKAANDKWAEKAFTEKAQELAEAFSTRAGPKFREQMKEFSRLAPEMQDVVRVHYLQKMIDMIDSGVGKTHDVAKLFDRPHYTNSIRLMFGKDAARDWTRMVRDLQVGTKSRNMLGNSATHRRGEAQVADDAESGMGLISAADNASVGGMRAWLMDNVRHFVRERRNRALNEVMTTPVSNAPRSAQHIHEMRRGAERLKDYEAAPERMGERLGKGAGFGSTRVTSERQRQLEEPRADGGRAIGGEDMRNKQRGLGAPRGMESGGGLSLFDHKLTDPLAEDFEENVEGSLHSANSPEADYYGETFGPEAGRYAQDLFDTGDVAKDYAKFSSGLAIPEAVGEGRLGDAAFNAAMMGIGPMAKGLGKGAEVVGGAMRAAPKTTAGLGAASILGASAADAGDPVSGAPTEKPSGPAMGVRIEQLQKAKSDNMAARHMLGQERSDNLQGKTGTKKAGPGPVSQRQDAEMQKLIAEGERIDEQIAQATRESSPEYVAGRDKMNEAEATRQQMLDSERKGWGHDTGTQGISEYWSAAPFAAGLGTAALMRVPSGLSKQFQKGRWWKAVDQAERGKDKVTRGLGLAKADEFEKAIPVQTGADFAKSYIAPGLLGGAEGAALSNVPEAWNTFLPKENQEKAAYEEYLKRMPADFPEGQADVDKATAHVKSLPDTNPTRDRAMRHFNEGDWKTRAGVGATEGLGGGLVGNTLSKPFAPFESSYPRPETRALLKRGEPTGLGSGPSGASGLGSAPKIPPAGSPTGDAALPSVAQELEGIVTSQPPKALAPPKTPAITSGADDLPPMPTAATQAKPSATPSLDTPLTANDPAKKVKRRRDLFWQPGGGVREEDAWKAGGGRWRKKAKAASRVEKVTKGAPVPEDVLAPPVADKIIAKGVGNAKVRAALDAGDFNAAAAILAEGTNIPAHRLLDSVLKAAKHGRFD